jgi:signal transduction histidine kinase/CheY-like chemotaxis protein
MREVSSVLRPSARRALEWTALIALLVAIAGYVAFELRDARQATEATELARLEHQANVVEKMLGTQLQATANALDALRADVPAYRAKPDGASRLNELMQVMVASMAGVRSFLLVDARGLVVASNRSSLIGIDVHDGERYRAIRAHPDPSMLFLSPPFLTPLGTWALSLGKAVLDPRGGFDGYLLAIIDPEYFQLLLDSTRYAPDMAAAMIHGGGKLIYRVPDPSGAAGRDLSERPDSAFSRHLRSGLEISSTIAILSTTGQEALMVFRNIRPTTSATEGHLVAFFSRDTAALFDLWRKEVRDRSLMLAVFGVAAALALHLMQRRRADQLRQQVARAALRAQAAESQKLESIGRLAGGVAHDFNNLLTVILSSGGEAQQEARRGHPPDPEILDELMTAAERAAELTRQLLAFARKQVIAPVTLDVNENLRSSQKLLRRVIGEDVRVVEHLEPDLWPVRCDPGLLGQVVLNLAVNARDAMPNGGTLTLTTRNITVSPADTVSDSATPPGDYVQLTVEDSGTGMTPEVAQHVFEPFFTTKGPGKGTGLGLSTVYGIVKQSGAHIGVRSAPEQGTAFEILFPRCTGTATAPRQVEPCGAGGTETILVVEDENAVRAAVAHGLRAAGYRVLEAADADRAVELASGEPGGIHLLLTDVVMPGRRGPEVARLVAERCPRAPVIYMSGHPQDIMGQGGVLAAEVDFLSKPFTMDALRAQVRAVLDRRPRGG